MKYIRIFLASSIVDLVHDRDAIGNFVRKLNDACLDQNIPVYLRLFLCEMENEFVSDFNRKQEEYNEEICRCDIFLNLYFNKAGIYTREELEVARKSFAERGKPRILVMFRATDLQEISYRRQEEVESFRQGIPDSICYSHIDQVKEKLLEALMKVTDQIPIHRDRNVICIGEIPVWFAGLGN